MFASLMEVFPGPWLNPAKKFFQEEEGFLKLFSKKIIPKPPW